MGQSILVDGTDKAAVSLIQVEEKPLKPLWKCLASEFIGTVMLIFIGCGCGLKLTELAKDDRPLPGVALCWAFTIASLSQTFGTYSCDLNPAISLAMCTTRKLPILNTALYIVTQCVGCTCGAYLLKLVTPEHTLGNFSVTVIPEDVGAVRGLFIEIIITTFLVFFISSVNDPNRKDLTGSLPLSTGFCIGALILFAAPFTGASMNPARSLGPSIVANHFNFHWVFWVGPIVGAQIGAHLYQFVFLTKYATVVKAPQLAAV